jgi:hypothetical protein
MQLGHAAGQILILPVLIILRASEKGYIPLNSKVIYEGPWRIAEVQAQGRIAVSRI